jgi:hypothetical protein
MGPVQTLPLANVILPYQMVGCWQLLLGNILLGMIEAKVIQRFFRPGQRAPWGTMIVANYFSSVLGLFLMPFLAHGLGVVLLGAEPLHHLTRWVWGVLGGAFVLTVILEWPFVWPALPPAPHIARRSLVACCVAQAATYLLLLAPYWLLSDILSDVQVAAPAQVSRHPKAEVLLLSLDGREMHRVLLDGSPARFERALPVLPMPAEELRGLGVPQGGRAAGLWLDGRLLDDAPSLVSRLAPDADATGYRVVADFRPKEQRVWNVDADPYRGGLDLDKYAAGKLEERFFVSVTTPVHSWGARAVTVLPGDQVVFELEGQVVLLDIPTRRLALVAIGRSPVVLAPPEGW